MNECKIQIRSRIQVKMYIIYINNIFITVYYYVFDVDTTIS